ncbi:toxin ParE [Candidatus Termititenax aidoneus]|uniref:Toxin ParE n=1 Tax=Termititenax aidoneus TaxID=2218524 RepID=A0A388TBR1_TERA1|nr:toxin ParE [Candidatus Termititenax aidoneus]
MEVKKTKIFDDWLLGLKDRRVITIITANIKRISQGNMSNVKSVGEKVFEKKIYFGAGYRLYFVNKNGDLIILLCGGDKSTQEKDIKLAQKIAKEI